MTPGETLLRLRETRPLVHQITNYVVMNETANATLAVGGQPVMAHAREEVEEMVALAGALVLNIGTLSPDWVDAMLLAGRAANDARDAGRARPGRRRRDDLSNADRAADPRRGARDRGARQCRRGGDARRRRGGGARRRLGRRSAASRPSSRCRPARALGLVVSVTGPVDHASDGERVVSVSNGHPLLASITGTGCMLSAVTGCFLAATPDDAARCGRRGARRRYGVAGEDAAREGKGPGSFHVALYDALAALDPATLDARARIA